MLHIDWPEPRIVESVREVAEKIRFAGPRDGALGKVTVLIGAGCSVTAGIPGAADITRRLVREVARRFGLVVEPDDAASAYRALVAAHYLSDVGAGLALADQTERSIDWYKIYDEMFGRHYAVPDDTRELFSAIVEEAQGAINWAHLCLGELAVRRYISTVLTTNFDQLALLGMVRAGLLPVVCDGIESLNRIAGAPRHAQLIELHGSRHSYLLRNRPDQVKAIWQNHQASAAIEKLLQHATTFVVVGYGGREDGVMDLLVQAAEVYPDKNLFWVQHSPDAKTLSPKARAFLATSRNGGLLIGRDADGFFLDLCRALDIGTPTALSDPLKALGRVINEVEASQVTNPDVRAEIDGAKARHALLRQALAGADQDGLGANDAAAAIRDRLLAGDYADAYILARKEIAK